jgi:hypothetical protein
VESKRKTVPAGQRDQSAAALPGTIDTGADDLDLPRLVLIVVVVLSDNENGWSGGE